MDRLSTSASPGEALCIVCLVSAIAAAATLTIQFVFPALVKLYSGAQLTALLG